jgi:protein-L-isoaspartate O-methyltransferase
MIIPGRIRPFIGGLTLLLIWAVPVHAQERPTPSTPETKEAPYVPTPQYVVGHMLELADVTSEDTVFDLGSGDGRIVLTAAKAFGARGVGIEIDSGLVERARRNARRAGVADRTTFHRGDLFEANLAPATVVTLYLWPNMNNRLRPKLLEELDPGTRVVSHGFGIDGWAPDTTVTLDSSTLPGDSTEIYLWTVPD